MPPSSMPRARSRLHHAARPSAVGRRVLIEVRGEQQKDGKLKIWAADKNGVLCGEMDLEFASMSGPSTACASST